MKCTDEVIAFRMGRGMLCNRFPSNLCSHFTRFDAPIEPNITRMRHKARKAGGTTADVKNAVSGAYPRGCPRIVAAGKLGRRPWPLVAKASLQLVVKSLVTRQHRGKKRQSARRLP